MMDHILNIYKLLDWKNNQATQNEGIILASQIDDLSLLIQPCSKTYNKNIWENCAVVLAQKSDDVLYPYLFMLLEWVQDLTWPGAVIIRDRLQAFDNRILLNEAIKTNLIRAQATGDLIWEQNLLSI